MKGVVIVKEYKMDYYAKRLYIKAHICKNPEWIKYRTAEMFSKYEWAPAYDLTFDPNIIKKMWN